MKTSFFGAFVRHALTFGSGYLVSRGLLDEQQATEAAGALVGLAGLFWSIIQKKAAATAPKS